MPTPNPVTTVSYLGCIIVKFAHHGYYVRDQTRGVTLHSISNPPSTLAQCRSLIKTHLARCDDADVYWSTIKAS